MSKGGKVIVEVQSATITVLSHDSVDYISLADTQLTRHSALRALGAALNEGKK